MAHLPATILLSVVFTWTLPAQEPEQLAAAGDFGSAANGFLSRAHSANSNRHPLEAAVALSNAANCLKMTGDISAASLRLKEAAELLPADAPEDLRIAMRALAGSIGSLGKRPWEALPVLQDAERRSFAEGLKVIHADILNDLGIAHAALGDHKAAMDHFERAITAANVGGDGALRLRATQNLVISAFQRWKRAEQDHTRAEELKSPEEKHFDAMTVRDGGAPEATRSELMVTASELRGILHRADLLLRSEAPSILSIHLTITTGLANHRHGWKRTAFRQLSSAVDHARILRNRMLERESILGLSEIYLDDGRASDALACIERARAMNPGTDRIASARIELLSARAHVKLSPIGMETCHAVLRAVAAVEGVRSDIARSQAISDLGRPFRERAGLPYLMLADLALSLAARDPARGAEFVRLAEEIIPAFGGTSSAANTGDKGTMLARNAVELFKAWELQDYYRDDCVNVTLSKQRKLDDLGESGTAVLYVIPCSERTEVLLGTARGIFRETSDIPGDVVLAAARRLRSRIQWDDGTFGFLDESELLHRAIIAPIHALLSSHRIRHLVFVPDGALAAIPLGALRDRTTGRFLLEDLSISVAPGLAMIPAQEDTAGISRILLAGCTLASDGFPALPGARAELEFLRRLYPRHRSLVDGEFSRSAFQKELVVPEVSMVHLATHGEFKGRADQTFLLCGDGRITLDDLERMIRPRQFHGTPVNLLSLSACKTADGDDRAALGLAGAAVKSGSRTVLATLWQVDDESATSVMTSFHSKLAGKKRQSKAAMLREAQLDLLRQGQPFTHPSLWAPFVIIGDWK